jgi:hypothetical protein
MAHSVDGVWEIWQSNGYKVRVEIAQPRFNNELVDGDLTGSAQEITPHGTQIADVRLQMGRLTGNSFTMVVDWGNNSIGQYNGTFDLFNGLSGVTFDQNNQSAQATWVRVNI